MPTNLPDAGPEAIPDLRTAEFTALRRAIAVRGTARMIVAPVACAVWAVLAVVVTIWGRVPWESLLPLAVLVSGFEAVHALHVGAERIGRYLQVYYEAEPNGPRWETAAMTVGPALPGGGVDPLFSVVFVLAAAVNAAAAIGPSSPWPALVIVAGGHAAFVFRVLRARLAAARQRAIELESFRALLVRDRNRH